jgi:hypothetical protein
MAYRDAGSLGGRRTPAARIRAANLEKVSFSAGVVPSRVTTKER